MRIAGIVACVPPGKVANDPKVAAATGIPARRVAPDGVSALDLCLAAARRVLADTAARPEDFGAILAVSFTQRQRMPSLAAQAQARLGFPKDILAFDVLQACAGWGYGLYLASLFVRETGKKVLLLDGDKQSDFLDAHDPSTAPLLSDGGTATVVEREEGKRKKEEGKSREEGKRKKEEGKSVEDSAFCSAEHGKDASATALLPSSFFPLPSSSSPPPFQFSFLTDGAKGEALTLEKGGTIKMDGFGVFRFVATDVVRFLKEFLGEVGGEGKRKKEEGRNQEEGKRKKEEGKSEECSSFCSAGQSKNASATALLPSSFFPLPSSSPFFVPHQPNVYLVRQLAKAVGLEDRVLISADRFGNLASASVPTTIAAHAETLTAGDVPPRILFAGFGGGLAISAGLVDLPRDCKLAIVS